MWPIFDDHELKGLISIDQDIKNGCSIGCRPESIEFHLHLYEIPQLSLHYTERAALTTK